VKMTRHNMAIKDAAVDKNSIDLLEGTSAIALIRGDVVETAKGMRDFAKTNPALVIKGGVVDGQSISAEQVTKMADVESREVLLSKMAGALKAKQGQAAAVFQALPTKAVRLAQALSDKRSEEAA